MKPPHEREGKIIGIGLSHDSLTKAHAALVRVEESHSGTMGASKRRVSSVTRALLS